MKFKVQYNLYLCASYYIPSGFIFIWKSKSFIFFLRELQNMQMITMMHRTFDVIRSLFFLVLRLSKTSILDLIALTILTLKKIISVIGRRLKKMITLSILKNMYVGETLQNEIIMDMICNISGQECFSIKTWSGSVQRRKDHHLQRMYYFHFQFDLFSIQRRAGDWKSE